MRYGWQKKEYRSIYSYELNAGLVTREVDETDRRNFKLHATRKALQLIPRIEEIIDKCHRTITADLTAIECDILVNLTRKVRSRTEMELGHKHTPQS